LGNNSIGYFHNKQTRTFPIVKLPKDKVTMTVYSSLDSALRLNNEAVSLILSGQERRALSKLQDAVGMVKRNIVSYLHRSAGISRTSKGLCPHNSNSNRSEGTCLPTMMTLEQLHQDSVQLSGLVNLQCYVYNRAFRVSAEQLSTSTMEKAAQIGSAIVIFNMALVLHRACLLHNRTVPVSKPLALYNIVLQLLKSPGSPTTVDSSSLQDIAGAIQLAALNNTAQLQFEVGEYSHATRGFDNLANLLTTIRRAPLAASDMRGIVLNILCLKKGANFAPAA
jgi:hypothetical protein